MAKRNGVHSELATFQSKIMAITAQSTLNRKTVVVSGFDIDPIDGLWVSFENGTDLNFPFEDFTDFLEKTQDVSDHEQYSAYDGDESGSHRPYNT